MPFLHRQAITYMSTINLSSLVAKGPNLHRDLGRYQNFLIQYICTCYNMVFGAHKAFVAESEILPKMSNRDWLDIDKQPLWIFIQQLNQKTNGSLPWYPSEDPLKLQCQFQCRDMRSVNQKTNDCTLFLKPLGAGHTQICGLSVSGP